MSKPPVHQRGDQVQDAGILLDQVIAEDAADTSDEISVEEALQQKPTLRHDSGRTKTRVLFVTTDTSFLNPDDDALERFYSTTNEFSEIHIMVLHTGSIPTKPVLRVRENVWIYIANTKRWWWTPVIAHEVIAANQLVFAGGFRPDLIIALEPFEAALAAQWIGDTYRRPVQIHIRENIRSKYVKHRIAHRWRRMLLARYVLRRARSVRAQTTQIRNAIQAWCRQVDKVKLLPEFYNFQSVRDTVPEFSVHDRYPKYEKILIYVGPLDARSSLYDLIDVLKIVLANPRVGLIVLGDGSMKQKCQKKISKIGLDTQVVFPKQVTEIISYMKTGDTLIVTDNTAVADYIAMQGAIARIPSVLTATEMRRTYFTDGESAFLCAEGSLCKSETFVSVVHDTDVRTRITKNLEQNVVPKLARLAASYSARYRESIEMVFVEDSRTHGVKTDEVVQ